MRNSFLQLLFKSALISDTKFVQNQPSPKISSEKFFFFKTKHASEFGKALDAGKLLEYTSKSFAARWFESIARVMGSQIAWFSNDWTSTRDHQKWMEGISNLPALDPFQEILCDKICVIKKGRALENEVKRGRNTLKWGYQSD